MPRYLSLALILEEGLDTHTLWQVVQSIARETQLQRVPVVTGDTKVVERGKGDGIFINTTGVGELSTLGHLAPSRIQQGDAILVTGDLGRHGVAIMGARGGFEFDSPLESDCACLWPLLQLLADNQIQVHCARDLTRGGLVSALNEIAEVVQLNMRLEEAAIPVHESVRGVCEILGLDPLHVACEGRMVLFLPREQADTALALLHGHKLGQAASCIGQVLDVTAAKVTLKNTMGVERFLHRLAGEQLPRIC